MPGFKPPRFVFLINRAQRAIQRWVEGQPDVWEGISSAQVGLLFLLASRGDAAIGEIAQELGVAPAAVTNLSKRMEGAKLIDRIADAHDGRLTRLRLTPAGVDANAQARAVLLRLNEQLTAGFSQEELDTVARWLTQVSQLQAR
jgi:DNA-binding MarR family transcriptional regulator